MFEKDNIVLFQGDSITDGGRDRNEPSSMGFGYAMMIASLITAKYPEKNIRFINRGISGNRVFDLQSRWKKDCLDIKPDYLSILIGINDTWRRYDQDDPISMEEFESGYRDIIDKTLKETNAKIILCEPFLLHISAERMMYREDLDPKIFVVRKLAREYRILLVSFDKMFMKLSKDRPPAFWANDGVHPSLPGHAAMALEWLKVLNIEI